MHLRLLARTWPLAVLALSGSSCQLDALGKEQPKSGICGAEKTGCGEECVDLATDPRNCGSCANRCASGLMCSGSTCVPDDTTCDGELVACAGQCVDLEVDPAHCGACLLKCNAGVLCSNRKCEDSLPDPCTPGESEACYSGPPETEGVGPCKGGTRYCADTGVFGPCVGEQVPVVEICGNGVDEDCDGVDPPAGDCVLRGAGLVARYYLDEADSAQLLPAVNDAAPAPVHLPMVYGADPSQPHFIEKGGHRGLVWASADKDGGPSQQVDSTKLRDLHGLKVGTVEVVLEVESVTGNVSRFLHFGKNNDEGRFTLGASSPGELLFFLNNGEVGRFPLSAPLDAAGRVVVHAVLDTDQDEPQNRLRLFVSGKLLPNNNVSPPGAGATVNLPSDNALALGNRANGSRSFKGILYYAALYSTALTAEDVQHNAKLLAASDDTP